jgi:hypothetical protein
VGAKALSPDDCSCTSPFKAPITIKSTRIGPPRPAAQCHLGPVEVQRQKTLYPKLHPLEHAPSSSLAVGPSADESCTLTTVPGGRDTYKRTEPRFG